MSLLIVNLETEETPPFHELLSGAVLSQAIHALCSKHGLARLVNHIRKECMRGNHCLTSQQKIADVD